MTYKEFLSLNWITLNINELSIYLILDKPSICAWFDHQNVIYSPSWTYEILYEQYMDLYGDLRYVFSYNGNKCAYISPREIDISDYLVEDLNLMEPTPRLFIRKPV